MPSKYFARYTGDRLRQVNQLPTVANPVSLCAAAVIEQLLIAGSYLQELATITAGGGAAGIEQPPSHLRPRTEIAR